MKVRSLIGVVAALAASAPMMAVPAHAGLSVSPWTKQVSGLTATLLESVSFPDCLNGWAVGDRPNGSENVAFNQAEGTIIHTTDGGKTWSPKQTSKAPTSLESVFFFDAMHGWIGSDSSNNNDSYILYTTDGGATWTSVATLGDGEVDGITFTDAQHGLAATGHGYVLKTSNGGVSWSRIFQTPVNGGPNSTTHSDVEGIAAFDGSHAWATTDASGGGATAVYGSINSPTFATQPSSGTTVEGEGLAFISATEGWFTGESSLLKHTTNGGATWTAQTPPAGLTGTDFESIAFPDPTHGWFVSDKGDIATTSNGGALWTQETSPTTNGLQQLVFHTRARGWAVGSNGTIINHLGPPTIAQVTPASGPTAGGTAVTISGCGLTGATQVKFGGTAGTGVTVVNDATITVTAPAGAAGPVDVTATTPKGSSGVSAADTFTFVAPAASPTPALPKAGATAAGSRGSMEPLVLVLLAAFVMLGAVVARRARTRA